MAKTAVLAACTLRLVLAECDCDSQVLNNWPTKSCYTLMQQGYDCSGCSVCVPGYDRSSWNADAWTTAVNKVRYAYGVPDLTWDQSIASDAYDWVKAYGSEHSCSVYSCSPCNPAGSSNLGSYCRPPPLGPSGENLADAEGSTQCTYIPDVVLGWASEGNDCYDWECSSCKPGKMCGHFTALTWKDVKTFGCGTTSSGVTICRFKGGDSNDCTTPNMGGCYEKELNDRWTYTYDTGCLSGLKASNKTEIV